jgi:ammonium transporter, Amt family
MDPNGGYDSGATSWVLTSTALVLLMSLPGLGVFYGGAVRSKNVLSVIAQCFAICSLSTVAWVLIGYSFTFGDGGVMNPFIGGFEDFFMAGISPSTMLGRANAAGTIPKIADAVYQGSYAFLSPALIVGSVVERMRSKPLLIYASIFLIIVYCPIAHQLWAPGGWMNQWGILDWAGGLVVGTTAGVAGLVATVLVGARSGYPSDSTFRPHNLTLVVIGTGMLWTGWIGFEGGTGLKADGVAAMSVTATHVAGAFGALTWSVIEWLFHHGRPSVLGFCAGAIAGLAAITPAAGYVGVPGAAAIGVLGTIMCFLMSVPVKHRIGWDETLDAFGVHATGGMTGTILVGIFGHPSLGGNGGPDFEIGTQLGKQIVGVIFTVAYTSLVSLLLLLAIRLCMRLRVSDRVERLGLDKGELDDGGYLFGLEHFDQMNAEGIPRFTVDDAVRAAFAAGADGVESPLLDDRERHVVVPVRGGIQVTSLDLDGKQSAEEE